MKKLRFPLYDLKLINKIKIETVLNDYDIPIDRSGKFKLPNIKSDCKVFKKDNSWCNFSGEKIRGGGPAQLIQAIEKCDWKEAVHILGTKYDIRTTNNADHDKINKHLTLADYNRIGIIGDKAFKNMLIERDPTTAEIQKAIKSHLDLEASNKANSTPPELSDDEKSKQKAEFEELHSQVIYLDYDDPTLCYKLGKCYLNGTGCERDIGEAISCFDRAANLNPYAAYQLFRIYYNGDKDGINKDLKLAMQYLDKSHYGFKEIAEKNHDSLAHFHLGEIQSFYNSQPTDEETNARLLCDEDFYIVVYFTDIDRSTLIVGQDIFDSVEEGETYMFKLNFNTTENIYYFNKLSLA